MATIFKQISKIIRIMSHLLC